MEQAARTTRLSIPLRDLWWAAFVLLGVSAGAVGWTIWELRSDAFRAAIAESGNIAAVLASQLSRSIYGIDFFGAAGIYGVASYRDLSDPPRGYSGLRRIPVDLTFNLGFRIDTSAGGFVFAFSNLLGLFPVRGEAGP